MLIWGRRCNQLRPQTAKCFDVLGNDARVHDVFFLRGDLIYLVVELQKLSGLVVVRLEGRTDASKALCGLEHVD